jgi:hypothetical protein
MPETIPTEAPEPPKWVAESAAGRWLWISSLDWRSRAALADKGGEGSAQWKRILLREAQQRYEERPGIR